MEAPDSPASLLGKDRIPLPHDLYKVSDEAIADLSRERPAWVASALLAAPSVVIRRAVAPAGMVAVGVRGSIRSERFGALVSSRVLSGAIIPELLVRTHSWRWAPRARDLPAIQALEDVAVILAQAGYPWGPVGSVGFELATGRPATSITSDLDILLRCARKLSVGAARQLEMELRSALCRVDVVMETPRGGVSLQDWAGAPDEVLLRTPHGPVLVADPWAEIPPGATRG